MDIETETKNEPENEEQPVKEENSERFVPFQFTLLVKICRLSTHGEELMIQMKMKT